MSAVERATIDLLAEKGPAAASIRDIAGRAGINHGLVHRHFGTKDELLRTVLAGQSDAIGSTAATLDPPDVASALGLLEQYPTYWRALTRAVLDAPNLFDDGAFPGAQAFLAMLGGDAPRQRHRETAVVTGALVMGWLVFGPHLSRAIDVEDREGLRDAVAAAGQEWVAHTRRRPAE